MNPKTSVRQVAVCWTPAEIHSIATTAFRDLAAEASSAGDPAAAHELERLAAASDVHLNAARRDRRARFVPPAQRRSAGRDVMR